MRQIAKWTILCVICTAFGFGATYLVAHSDRVIQTVAAMLPAHPAAHPALGELATKKNVPAETTTDVTAAKSDKVEVEFASQVAAAPSQSQPPVPANITSAGTLATTPGLPGADLLQTGPSTGP